MVDIHGPLPVILLGFCFVVGVSMWIGYLLGRVRTLDPHGQRRAPGATSPGALLVVGVVFLFGGGLLLAPLVTSGRSVSVDPGGVLFLFCAVFMLGIGVYFVRRAFVLHEEQR